MATKGRFVHVVPDVGVEPHPAVVISLSDDKTRALVLYGTGTKWADLEPVLIDPNRPDGASARAYLHKPTFFHLNGVRSCDVTSLDAREPYTTCPKSKWSSLKRLAHAGCQARLAEPEFAQWAAVLAAN